MRKVCSLMRRLSATVRLLAPRCKVNYRARVVMYLLEHKMVSAEEADRHLHPAVAGGYAQSEAQVPLLQLPAPRLLLVRAFLQEADRAGFRQH